MKRATAILSTLALTLFALVTTALPASAHNVLISSSPAQGEELGTAPTEVVLTFDQPVQDADVNEVAVTGPNGDQWAEGTVEVDGSKVIAPLRPLGPAGEYVVGYRVLSADGHPVSEEVRFTLTEPGTGEASGAPDAQDPNAGQAQPNGQGQQNADSPNTENAEGAENAEDTATAEDSESSGIPVWVWLVGAGVLLVAGLVVALRMGKSED